MDRTERAAARKYADIIDLPHPEPKGRQRMPAGDRAAQFAPFAALTGYGELIDETHESHDAGFEEELARGKF